MLLRRTKTRQTLPPPGSGAGSGQVGSSPGLLMTRTKPNVLRKNTTPPTWPLPLNPSWLAGVSPSPASSLRRSTACSATWRPPRPRKRAAWQRRRPRPPTRRSSDAERCSLRRFGAVALQTPSLTHPPPARLAGFFFHDDNVMLLSGDLAGLHQAELIPDCPLERARIGQPRASGFLSARRANNGVYWRGAWAERRRTQAPSRRVGRCDVPKCSSYRSSPGLMDNLG
jgi:hypothetical protein